MPVWPLKELAESYGFRLKDYEQRGKILFLETNTGSFALKRSNLDPAELDLEYSVFLHLLRAGCTRIARIIPTATARGFAYIDGQAYLLSAWINGTHPNFTVPAEVDKAASHLAHFHAQAQGYTGPAYWQKRKLYGVWPYRFSYRLNHLLWYRQCVTARGIHSEFDQTFMAQVDQAIEQAQQAITNLRVPGYYVLAEKARTLGTICHHDYTYHNLLNDKEDKIWLLDFDYCLLDMPLHDLGNMILHVLKLSNWSPESANRILLMYHRERPLQQAELDALFSFVQFPQDFWQIAWAYYAELGMHKPENLLVRLRRQVETADARNHFLSRFAELIKPQKFLPRRESL
ncbi:MAG TPA: CotS family spore coat protein [Desulfobacteria bacterium]|nr:CotS family spore coat protein [Desulfobacteria bacterium]